MQTSSRPLLNLGLLLLFLTLTLGLAVSFGWTKSLDVRLLKALAMEQGETPAVFITLARALSWLGDAAQRSLIFLLVAAWLVWRARVRTALIMIVMPILAAVTTDMLKEAFGRARPDIVPHLGVFGNLSYPSGHASNAASIFILVALILPGKRPRLQFGLGLAGAALVSLSRVWLGVHWPSDVIGGLMWGAGFAMIALHPVQVTETGK
jgi:membrane-associated phospholipid phosphatase